MGMNEISDILNSPPGTVFLRSFTHQVVFGEEDFYYKVYEVDRCNSNGLDHLVRCCLQKVYTNLGLHWELTSFEQGDSLFDVEQRQILKVANEEVSSFQNILLSFSKLLDEVEELLGFDRLLSELHNHEEFSSVEAMKLSRHVINKHNDYAMFNGQAILLDDSEFCIEFLDKNDEVLDIVVDAEIPVVVNGVSYTLYSMSDTIFYGWGLRSHEQQDVLIAKQKCEFNSQLLTNENSLLAASVEMASEANVAGVKLQYSESEVFESLLTDSVEDELYSQLDEAYLSGKEVFLLTCFHHGQTNIWESHMKTITTYYPNVHKITSVEMTQEVCSHYLNGIFDPRDFSGRYSTEIRYKPPTIPSTFPTRDTFRKFLLKYAKINPEGFGSILDGEAGARNCYSDSNVSMVFDYQQIRDSTHY